MENAKKASTRATNMTKRAYERKRQNRARNRDSERVCLNNMLFCCSSVHVQPDNHTNKLHFHQKTLFLAPSLSLFCSLSLGRFFVVQCVFLWMLFIFRTFNFCNAEFDGRTDQRGRSHVTLHNNNKFHYIHRRTQKYYANFFSLLFWVKPVRASQRTTI